MTERERFEAVFRTHYQAVARFLVRRTDPATAEDLTAEVFAIAWRRIDRVPAEPLPWLYVTARHCLANHRRSDRRAQDRQRRAEPPPAPIDPLDAVAGRDHVLHAFAQLSERDREALRLVTWDGLSLADAARVAGIPRPAFAARVSRARRRLAAHLADPLPAELLETMP
jgi:RNA polymerase sigma factor (sigma-70 family)